MSVSSRFVASAMIVANFVLAPAAAGHEPHLRGVIPNHTQEAAIAEGERIGIGTARLIGPRQVEVFSHQTWRFVFTAGKAGIKPGGGLRVAFRHLPYWSMPQSTDPKGLGYFTAKAEGGQRLLIKTKPERKLFGQYFAWQQMVEVILPDSELAPGATLELVYGDRRGGSPGIRVQPFDESYFVFKTYVDALGSGTFLPLRKSPAIEIIAATPCRLNVVMPTDAVVGEPTWCLVRAEDRFGNPATSYRAAVRLSTTDSNARLPAKYTFTAADRGVHRFENVVFSKNGLHTVSVGDGQFQATGNPVRAARQRPERLLLWGDLHGHTLMSDGRGTVEEFYDFAQRVAGLDFCAVTDHAFEILDEMWAHSKKITNQAYQPGRFVTFQAYEWSGITPLGGDHNCYFLDDDPPIFRSTLMYSPHNFQMYHGPDPKQEHVTDVFAELRKRLKDKNVFCIPHFGGRKGNPKWHDAKVQRMIEIFSEHQRSETWTNTFLAAGHRLGIIASTDGHYGNPGYGYLKPDFDWDHQEIGMAAVAVHAPARTREAVFRALYDRHVYATSGDRIILGFQVDGHAMGSEFQSNSPPTLTVDVVGTADVARIEIKKDGKVVHQVQPNQRQARLRWRDPAFDASRSTYYYVRVIQRNNEEAISSPVWVN